MARINLVIADSDEYYAETLGNFVRHGYSSEFNVTVFSKLDPIKEFLKNNTVKIDLVLADSLFYPAFDEACCPQIKVLLSDGRLHGLQGVANKINKYQRGETIVAKITELFAGSYGSRGELLEGCRQTSMVTVFSPQGGSGKTTFAYGIAVQLSSKGKKVLYLNLEYFSFVPFAAETLKDGLGLSSIILRLKGSPGDLISRINAVAAAASQMVTVLEPPDNPIELDELGEIETVRLFELLKEAGHFDAVIVDTPSVLNRMTAALLKISSNIIMVLDQSVSASGKLEFFKNAVNRIMPEVAAGVQQKSITVFNRCISPKIKQVAESYGEICFYVPYAEDMYVKKEDKYILNFASKAFQNIERISDYLISQDRGVQLKCQ